MAGTRPARASAAEIIMTESESATEGMMLAGCLNPSFSVGFSPESPGLRDS